MVLRVSQARLREVEMPRVRLQLTLDPVEFMFARLYELDGPLDLQVDLVDLPRTLSAPRAAAIPGGSADVVPTVVKPTATKIAVRMVRIAGAFRLPELTTASPAARVWRGARVGGRGRVAPRAARPSRVSGRLPRSTEPKT